MLVRVALMVTQCLVSVSQPELPHTRPLSSPPPDHLDPPLSVPGGRVSVFSVQLLSLLTKLDTHRTDPVSLSRPRSLSSITVSYLTLAHLSIL